MYKIYHPHTAGDIPHMHIHANGVQLFPADKLVTEVVKDYVEKATEAWDFPMPNRNQCCYPLVNIPMIVGLVPIHGENDFEHADWSQFFLIYPLAMTI